MRQRERRTIEANLREHARIMAELEAIGMTRETASREAFIRVRKNNSKKVKNVVAMKSG